MVRGCTTTASVILLVILIASISLYRTNNSLLSEEPSGNKEETVTSPTERYSALLWRCCQEYNFISGFDVRDSLTGQTYRQRLKDVLGVLPGGISFSWLPSENYLLVTTRNRVTSHGCMELLVYKGDGSALVYSSVPDSVCSKLGGYVDSTLSVIATCANDDLVFEASFCGATPHVCRLTPSTRQWQSQLSKTC